MSLELKQTDDIDINETTQCTDEHYDEEMNQPIDNLFDIGNNIILFDKYVCGIKSQLKYLFFTILSLLLIVVTYSVFILPLLEGIVFFFILITILGLYVLTQTFHLMCFMTEPGIIPRNCDLYQKKCLGDEDIVFYYRSGEIPKEGEVPLFMM